MCVCVSVPMLYLSDQKSSVTSVRVEWYWVIVIVFSKNFISSIISLLFSCSVRIIIDGKVYCVYLLHRQRVNVYVLYTSQSTLNLNCYYCHKLFYLFLISVNFGLVAFFQLYSAVALAWKIQPDTHS